MFKLWLTYSTLKTFPESFLSLLNLMFKLRFTYATGQLKPVSNILLDNSQDIFLPHNQVFHIIQFYFRTGIFTKQNLITYFHF